MNNTFLRLFNISNNPVIISKRIIFKLIKICLLFILPIMAVNNVSGQTVTLTIKGSVSDNKTGEPIENVNLLVVKNKTGTITNRNGVFELKLNSLPDTIRYSHINYKSGYFVVKTIKDTLFNILMKKTVYTLDEINIENEKTVYNRKLDFTILDYNFIHRNILILQKNIGINASASLVILNENLDTITYSNNLPKNPIKLYKDCLKNYHVLTKDSAYQIIFYSDSLMLMKPFGIDRFYKTLGDCLFRIGNNIYFKNKLLFGFGTHIYSINEISKKRTELLSSIDSVTYHRLLLDICDISSRYWGHNIPISSIENDSLLMNNINKHEYSYRFLKEIGDKPKDNFVFHINDTIVFFDFNNYFIQLFNIYDSLPQKVKIKWDKSVINKSEVIEDEVKHKFYVIYRKSGSYYLYLVNLHDGTLSYVTRFSQMTYDKIKVNNSTLYYLFKNFNNHAVVKQLYVKNID